MKETKEYNFKDVKDFLRKNYKNKNYQIFDSRNIIGDPMETVYSKNGVTIDECTYYGYLEIFGLTEEDFDKICNKEESHTLKI